MRNRAPISWIVEGPKVLTVDPSVQRARLKEQEAESAYGQVPLQKANLSYYHVKYYESSKIRRFLMKRFSTSLQSQESSFCVCFVLLFSC